MLSMCTFQARHSFCVVWISSWNKLRHSSKTFYFLGKQHLAHKDSHNSYGRLDKNIQLQCHRSHHCNSINISIICLKTFTCLKCLKNHTVKSKSWRVLKQIYNLTFNHFSQPLMSTLLFNFPFSINNVETPSSFPHLFWKKTHFYLKKQFKSV